jgi:hypothetical protein
LFCEKLICLLFTSALLVMASNGCGGNASSSRAGARTQTRVGETSSLDASSGRRGVGRYLNDHDIDPIGDTDEDNGHDVDKDPLFDYKLKAENDVYLDIDDSPPGPEADPADRRAIKALVERYCVAASAGNGGKTCAMFTPGSAKNVPRYANSSLAPAYMRGGKTCAATMDRLFKHFHHWLSSRVVVTDVRLKSGQAFVVLGSMTMPARYVEVAFQRGTWWLEIPLAGDPLLANDLG